MPGHWAAQCPQNASRATSTKHSPSTTPGNSPKKARTDGSAMMVRDMAKQNIRGCPAFGPSGWFGIQDGGASSVVIGHNTLLTRTALPQCAEHRTTVECVFLQGFCFLSCLDLFTKLHWFTVHSRS